MSRIVVALGGNALGNTANEQKQLVKETVIPIVELIKEGHEVIIAHGNGPQVGMINLAFAEARKVNPAIADMPFPECGAMSQGYIGYHLQNALQMELKRQNIQKGVATIVTQVLVDESDPAFDHPTKPIGKFYTEAEAKELALASGHLYVNDANRGYRRVIASPNPLGIVEIDVVRHLVKDGFVVITCGGGGIPVVLQDDLLVGVDAVIDKDYASAKLAELLDADIFIILTAVEQVCLYFGKPNQVSLPHMSVAQAEQYLTEGHFAKGSMYPKVVAACRFAKTNPKRKAIIAALEKAKEALKEQSGTAVTL